MRLIFCRILALFQLMTLTLCAQDFQILTVFNQADEPATVAGPTAGYLEISPGANKTVMVSGGAYHLLIRYCSGKGHCRYSKADPFTITQTFHFCKQNHGDSAFGKRKPQRTKQLGI